MVLDAQAFVSALQSEVPSERRSILQTESCALTPNPQSLIMQMLLVTPERPSTRIPQNVGGVA